MLVGVILPESTADPRDPLGELASLAKTAGAKVVGHDAAEAPQPRLRAPTSAAARRSRSRSSR